MFNLEHFFFFTILFALSFLLTQKSSRNYERNFWGAAAFFIIAYTVIVGLRYGWGHDYVRYEYAYNMLEYDYSKDYDLAYWNLYKIEKGLGLSFAGSVLLSTLLIIVSYFYIVKAMKGDKYMLMCFLPATLLVTTYALRQFQAVAYINIAIALVLFSDDLLKKKKISIIIAALLVYIAYHTHAASIVYAIPFAVCLLLRKMKPIPFQISVPAYLGVIVFAGIITSLFNDLFLSYFESLTATDHLQAYIDQADGRLFGADSVDETTFAHGGIYQIFHYVGYICLLYVSGRALKIRPHKGVTIIYNVVVVAILLQQVFFSQEMMRRVIDPFAILYFIPVGYAINVLMLHKKQRFKGYELYAGCTLVALLLIYYPMLKFLISFDLAGFVWN